MCFGLEDLRTRKDRKWQQRRQYSETAVQEQQTNERNKTRLHKNDKPRDRKFRCKHLLCPPLVYKAVTVSYDKGRSYAYRLLFCNAADGHETEIKTCLRALLRCPRCRSNYCCLETPSWKVASRLVQ